MSKVSKPPKAYRNLEFLNSPAARTIRILAEYNEPMARFKKHGIENLIVFFGSSRSPFMLNYTSPYGAILVGKYIHLDVVQVVTTI